VKKMEEFTFDYVGLASLFHMTVGSVKHKSTQSPGDLPPCVEIGEGVRKKRIWLASTVFKWLKEKQQGCAGIPPAPVLATTGRQARPPGRPRKAARLQGSSGVEA
jgi:hypothetical protein